MKLQSRAGIKAKAREHHLAIDSVPPVEAPPDDGGGHGGYVCFACGRSTRHGEPFVCASRLWKVCEEGQAYQTVIDAVASLQVCIPCTIVASDHRLAWKSPPRVLRSEILGYYTFARRLAHAVARRLSDTEVNRRFLIETALMDEPEIIRSLSALGVVGGAHQTESIRLMKADQCCICDQMVDCRLPNMEIEIAVNVPTPGSIRLLSNFTVARYCNTCSTRLFPIDNCGRLDC